MEPGRERTHTIDIEGDESRAASESDVALLDC